MPILDQLKDPKLLPLILGGAGAAGLAGGVLSARTKQRRNETPGGKRLRVLRNALLAAGAGAGAVGLGAVGVNSFKHALPEGDVDPVTQAVTGPVTRGASAAATFVGLNSLIGSEKKRSRSALAQSILGVTDDPALKKYLQPGGQLKPDLLSNVFNRSGFDANLPAGRAAQNIQDKATAAVKGLSSHVSGDAGAQNSAMRKALIEAGLSPSGGKQPVRDLLGAAKHHLWGTNSTIAPAGRRLLNPRARTLLAGAALFAPEIAQASGVTAAGISSIPGAIKDKITPPPTYQ